jgi:putative membrane-bound dehydrogenase-like protein
MKKKFGLILLFLPFILFNCGEKKPSISFEQLSDSAKRLPENALVGLKTHEKLVSQLFASEPMMLNPTNMDIDAKGRVWLCEGYNYRMNLNPNNPQKDQGDRIVILEDKDGDGKADESKLFYQGTDVNSALGICVLGSQVIVSSSPFILSFKDTDGDDKPDVKDTLFMTQGGLQHDHSAHAITFGHDGKLYFNFGNEPKGLLNKKGEPIKDQFGKPIIADRKPYQDGMVFRCDLDGSNVEVLGYNFRNNYEVAMDSYGTLWQSDNDDDGNQGVRINYVMEYGNFGFKDAITGASWQTRRTNLEKTIPQQHWHLNDPGVVPNLLQTGAGSPTGILIYEGNLLPKEFQNQIIHCDAGPNVVRAYPVENDGAGYKANIIDILKGEKDQWFRPSDVCVAPDGSLLVADWYDPGVGGHQVVDLNRGRVFRITTSEQKAYKVPVNQYDTPENAFKALQSPNMATRYLAWAKLNEWQAKAETVLANAWKNETNPRMKARALWLLSKIKGKGEKYVHEALQNENADLRICAIRAGREIKMDMLRMYKKLQNDQSIQVKREIALALRNNKTKEALEIWVNLASQYDGKDRWYLEALGIGADEQWDSFLPAYLEKNNDKSKKATQDIIWRSRAKNTPELLAELIAKSTGEAILRYFRAFDFQTEDNKYQILTTLLESKHPSQEIVNKLVLNHLDTKKVPMSPQIKSALNSALLSTKGTLEFVDLVKQYQVKDQFPTLLEMALSQPDSTVGIESAKILFYEGGKDMLANSLQSKDVKTLKSALKVIGNIDDKPAKDLILKVMKSETYEKAIRILALERYGTGWGGQNALWELVEKDEVPTDLKDNAKEVLTTSWRADIKNKALKYYEGGQSQTSTPISKLLTLKGDATKGKTVYAQYCIQCHQVGNEGIDFGPKLTKIGAKLPKEGLYKAILEPNEGISFGFEGFIFKLKDGKTVAGIIASETANQLDIKQVGGNISKVNKSEIQEKKPYNGSLMPKFSMPDQELADLVAYLQGLK